MLPGDVAPPPVHTATSVCGGERNRVSGQCAGKAAAVAKTNMVSLTRPRPFSRRSTFPPGGRRNSGRKGRPKGGRPSGDRESAGSGRRHGAVFLNVKGAPSDWGSQPGGQRHKGRQRIWGQSNVED